MDVLVVGGEATGAGIVLEATLRGYRGALVEGADFASGTSSRSTKQIHGGLRYLIRGDVRFVQESLREFLLTHSTKLLTPLRHIAPLELTGDPLVPAPWHGHLLLGTTDAACDPETIERPLATAADVAYLLEGLRVLAPDWPVTVTAAWAGVRPLLATDSERETVDLSRQDKLLGVAPGVLGIAGGKLTTLPAVAQRVCDLLEQRLGPRSGPPARFPHLTDPLESLNQEEQLLDAARHEMVATLDDLLTQRLSISLVSPKEAFKDAPEWATLVASTMGWSSAEQEQQVHAYRAGLKRLRVPSGVAG